MDRQELILLIASGYMHDLTAEQMADAILVLAKEAEDGKKGIVVVDR